MKLAFPIKRNLIYSSINDSIICHSFDMMVKLDPYSISYTKINFEYSKVVNVKK